MPIANDVAGILAVFQNVQYGFCRPVKGESIGRFRMIFLQSSEEFRPRDHDPIGFQSLGYPVDIDSTQIKGEYPFYDSGLGGIHRVLVLVFRFLIISVRGKGTGEFPVHRFGVIRATDLFADVSSIPFVHDVPERGELVVVQKGIDLIVDCNVPDIICGKVMFYVVSRRKIVSPQTGHVLGDDHRYPWVSISFSISSNPGRLKLVPE